MSSPNVCSTTIPPVRNKFRTGSYLIYDDPVNGPTNCRKGTALPVTETPFRASGSHQLDSGRLATVLKSVAPPDGQLYLVDLREETHLYFHLNDDNLSAVSWYADMDFANVGRSLEWILAKENAQVSVITASPQTKIFCITPEDMKTGTVTPTGYSDVAVKLALTEEGLALKLPTTFRPKYTRIPVTDHCMPSPEAVNRFVDLCHGLKPNDWVHCHCHGGDGRTTSFLLLFDMINWANKNGTNGFPTIDDFACRQCQLFDYCLNPNGCTTEKDCTSGISTPVDWKYYLAQERWLFLDLVRNWIANGGLKSGKPFHLPDDWEERIAQFNT